MSNAATHEPNPVKNTLPAIWEIIIQEMSERDAMGRAKHGGPLQPFNGRKSLWDAYQELLDLVAYLRQKIWEEEHPDQNPLNPPNMKVDEHELSKNGRGWYRTEKKDAYPKMYIFGREDSPGTYSGCIGYVYKIPKDQRTNPSKKWAWTNGPNFGTTDTKEAAKKALMDALYILYGADYV